MSSLASEGWRRNVWVLALTVFVAFVGFQFFSPFLPLYVHELGVTDPGWIALWSGLLAAVTPAVSGVLAPLFGRLADRFGRKLMLIRSLAGFVVIIAAMGLVTSVQQLFVARLVQGFFAGFTPMAMALATVSAPRDKVPAAIGMVQSAQLLSVAVGPAAGGYVASHFGIRYARMPMARVLRYPRFSLVVGLLLIAQFLDRGLALLIPLQVAHLPGIEAIAATSGLIISVAAVAVTISATLVGRLAREISSAWLLLLGLLAGGPLCAAMALARTWPSLLVLRTLLALCLGGAITLAYTLGAEMVPGDERGAAFGWLALGVQFGTAASPLVTGALAAVSLPGAYVFDGALAWGRRRAARLRLARSAAGAMIHAGLTQPPCTGWCEHTNSRNAGRPWAFASKARLSAGITSDGWLTSSPWKPTAFAMEAMHAEA